jgi:hypothetical protein
MKECDRELARLESERTRLIQQIVRYERQGQRLALITIPIAIVVAVLLALATVAGQVSLEGLLWTILLGGLFAYILTREIRWSGKVVFVFEIVMMISGQMIWARDDIRDMRQRLTACEARIAELKGR